jgi:hypothetical protein
MRRALGLRNTAPTQDRPVPPPTSPGASHSQRRRFIRDGEVPVSVIHRDQDDTPGTNKLDVTRQALREQIAAREHAEHLLQEAQATVHDLQTKLAHERIARDEAIRRVEHERQLVEQTLQRVQEELAIERDQRQQAEQERDEAIVACQEAEGRLLEVLAAQDAKMASQAPPRPTDDPHTTRSPRKTVPMTEPSAGGDKVEQPRRRGRPAKPDQSETEIVESWKPGWQDRFR